MNALLNLLKWLLSLLFGKQEQPTPAPEPTVAEVQGYDPTTPPADFDLEADKATWAQDEVVLVCIAPQGRRTYIARSAVADAQQTAEAILKLLASPMPKYTVVRPFQTADGAVFYPRS